MEVVMDERVEQKFFEKWKYKSFVLNFISKYIL